MEKNGDNGAFMHAVNAIYDCALAPNQWPMALEAIADAFGDVGSVLTYRRDDGQFVALVSSRLVDGQDEYNSTWHRLDVRSAAAAKRAYLLPADVLTDTRLGLTDLMDTHPFYTDFLQKRGLRWFAGMGISPDPHTFVTIGVQRAGSKPEFSDDECEVLGRLGLHAEKTLRIGMRMIEAESWSLGLRETFDRLNMGLFFVDDLGRTVFVNDAGNRLCGGGLQISNQRLSGTSVSGRRLDAIVDGVIAGNILSDVASGPILLRDESRTLAIHVIPLRAAADARAEPFLAHARAIVLAFEIKAGQAIDPSLIRDFLGVTLGEARIAALVASGAGPRDASQKLGISEETARTVLKRVFAKAGVSRQNELAALIGKMVLLRV